MSKFVGRRGTLGLARETTRGTARVPQIWVPRMSISFDDKTEQARESQGLGVIEDSDSKYVTQRMGEGEIEGEFYDKALGLFLISLTGTNPTTTGASPYTHTFTIALAEDNQHDSLSLLYQDPDINQMFVLGVVDSLKMVIEPGQTVKWTVGFKSKASKEWTSQTVTFTSLGSKFLHQHLVTKFAANIASLGAATGISLKKLELNFNTNTIFDSVLGTVEPEDILNQQFSIEGTLELNKEDQTYRNYMLAGTYKAMDITLNGGANSSLQMQFPRVDFSEWEQDRSLGDITKQTINFKANYDAANALSAMSTCILINLQSSYT